MNLITAIRSVKIRILIQIAILLMAFITLFGQTLSNLIQDWLTNDNYSHGFLIPVIAAYMIWQKRGQLAQSEIRASKAGFFIVFFALCIFILGNIGAELFIMRTAIVITITGVCLFYLGSRTTMLIAVPLLYLMFMIPLPAIIWNKIAFPLQLFAANITSYAVKALGIPLLREGNIMHLPNTTLEVVDACSGLRSLASLLALSAAFAYISNLNAINQWILFFCAIPIAVVVNILRLTFTALLARYIGPQVAEGFLHDFSGILVFIVALGILYSIYSAMQVVEMKIKTSENYR